MPSQHYFSGKQNMFNAPNWAQVMAGLDLFDKEYMRNLLLESHGPDVIKDQLIKYEEYLIETQKPSYIEHKILLNQNNIVVKFDRK